jgi:hypothetical protein
LDALVPDIHYLFNEIAGATNGAFSEDLLTGRIEKLRPVVDSDPIYTKEQTLTLLAIYGTDVDSSLRSCGISDSFAQYPDYCRLIVCCLFDKLVAGILWWFSNPSSAGLPNAQTRSYLANIWSVLSVMCAGRVSLSGHEVVVANSVRRWLDSSLVAELSKERREATGKLNAVISAIQVVSD